MDGEENVDGDNKHPQKEGPIRIRRTEGVVSQISSLTFSELVGKNLRKRLKDL